MNTRQVRKIALIFGLIFGILGAVGAVMWKVPLIRGPMLPGHESLECSDCHRLAQGSIRQQVQANARRVLRGGKAVWIGSLPPGNEACLTCHRREKDRHPVYRFLEPRFARSASGWPYSGAPLVIRNTVADE